MKKNQFVKNLRRYFLGRRHNKSIKKIMLEGGVAGHMMHPYNDDNLTFDDIREIIRDAQGGFKDEEGKSKLVEKVDGYNIFFTIDVSKSSIDPHKDIYFARNATSVLAGIGGTGGSHELLNMDGMVKKFKHHPGAEVFILGAEVIAQACTKIPISVLKSVFDTPSEEETIEDGEFLGSYVNTEIIYPPKPIQIRYDMPTISFHELVDMYKIIYRKKGKLEKIGFNDNRYDTFVNAFNRQNLNDIFEVSTNLVFGEEFDEEKHSKHEFKLIGSNKNRINVNTPTDSEVQEMISIVDNVQNSAGLKGTNTIGEMKAFYVKSVVADFVQNTRDSLMQDYGSIEEGLSEEDALKVAKFIVYCHVFKEYKLTPIDQEMYDSTAAKMKKYFTGQGKPKIQKFLSDAGLFSSSKNKKMIRKIGREIVSSYSESFSDLVTLFFMLGTSLLAGLKSNLVATDELSRQQGEEMKNELTLALQDYYSLPDSDDGRSLKNRLKKQVAKIEESILYFNKQKGIDVDLSNKEEVLEAIKNASIDPVEGVVYDFKGKRFKFTGLYAPFNQLVGFNTAKSFASEFPRYSRDKIKWDIKPETDSVAILPGSFKPPHMGHKKMVDFYMNKGVDQMLIIVSEPAKEENMRKIGERVLTAKNSILLWGMIAKEYIDAGRLSLIKSPVPSPIEATAALLAVGADRLKGGTDVYLCSSQKVEHEKIAGTNQKIIGSEHVKKDSARFDFVVNKHNRDQELNIMDYETNACPPANLPSQYIQDCKDLGIFETLPSQVSGKDSTQFHASDLRFLLNEASQREDLMPLLVHYLGSEQVARQYLEFIF